MTSMMMGAIGFGSGMLGAALVVAVAGEAPQRATTRTRISAKLEAWEFVLKDERGREWGSWYVADGGPPVLSVR